LEDQNELGSFSDRINILSRVEFTPSENLQEQPEDHVMKKNTLTPR